MVALEMPLVGKLFDLHSYSAAFGLAALLPIIGYALWRSLAFRSASSLRKHAASGIIVSV